MLRIEIDVVMYLVINLVVEIWGVKLVLDLFFERGKL
jgi:hypothetical protein